MLARALAVKPGLRTLVLFGPQLGDTAAAAIRDAFGSNSTLESLFFCGKSVTVDGLSAFAEMVAPGKQGSKLAELVIGGTCFDDSDASVLISAIGQQQAGSNLRKF